MISLDCLSMFVSRKKLWLSEKKWAKNEKKIDNIYSANKNYFLNGHLKFSYSIDYKRKDYKFDTFGE